MLQQECIFHSSNLPHKSSVGVLKRLLPSEYGESMTVRAEDSTMDGSEDRIKPLLDTLVTACEWGFPSGCVGRFTLIDHEFWTRTVRSGCLLDWVTEMYLIRPFPMLNKYPLLKNRQNNTWDADTFMEHKSEDNVESVIFLFISKARSCKTKYSYNVATRANNLVEGCEGQVQERFNCLIASGYAAAVDLGRLPPASST